MTCRLVLRSVAACLVTFAAGLGACGGSAKPVDEFAIAAAEGGLIAPFTKPLTVVTDELSIVMTANFYDELATPAGVEGSARRPRADGGSDFVFRNPAGGGHLTFLVRQTEIIVLGTARITVLGGRNDLAFDLEASGRVSLADEAGRRDGSRYRVSGGHAVLTP